MDREIKIWLFDVYSSIAEIYSSTFFCYHQKKVAKKSHRCMKVTKNLRHSLNCGNSSLRSSDSPQFYAPSLIFLT
jgi:hypothetical protein